MNYYQIYKKNLASIFAVFSLVLVFAPVFVGATVSCKGLVCECKNTKLGECTFDDVVATVKNATDKLSILALEFIVVVIAWGGFKYMTSGGNAGERSRANAIFVKAGIGICFILGAWLIVTLIASALGVTAFQFTM